MMMRLIEESKAAREYEDKCWANYKHYASLLSDRNHWSMVEIRKNLFDANLWFLKFEEAGKRTREAIKQVDLQRKLEEIQEFGMVLPDPVGHGVNSPE